ncbi:MAG: SPOR domain-containing protein [Prevotella sp.]|nr:SPOR domain-containing protein [Prevotella sp.]
MRQRLTTFILATGLALCANAQTFTQRVQQPAEGRGNVTIHQDAAIDELVNAPANAAAQQPQKPAERRSNTQQNGAQAQQQRAESGSQAVQQQEASRPAARTGRKVGGYRVQVYAGGNTRKDRQRAESIGSALRAQFPGEAVYVHFYSPRWICRMGNYRTYEDAEQMLQNVRRLGYSQASIVKGKVTQ